MPETPTLLLPYPAATDPADVPADMAQLATRLEAVRGAADGLASLDAAGKVPAAQLPALAVGYGTTLPAGPVDGQEHVLVDTVTNPTWQWRFRYNAGSTSPYKWEFVGGSPLQRVAGESQILTLSASVAILAPGGIVTVPRTGDYFVEISVPMTGSPATPHISNFAAYAATQLGEAAITAGPASAASVSFHAQERSRVNGLGVGTSIGIGAWSGQGNTWGMATMRWVAILPVRVA
jgi:hypothetical protein